MDISTGLIAKAGAGTAALAATTTTGIIYRDTIAEFLGLDGDWSDEEIEEKIGLDCRTDSSQCTLKAGQKLNVMEGDKKKRIEITSLSPASDSKIELHRNEKEYKKGLKFSISGGDITLNEGTGSDVTKLKKGASYEVKFSGDKWFLSQKTASAEEQEKIDGINGKLEKLGITKGDCKFKWGGEAKPCRLNKDELETVKFEGKGTGTLTITGNDKFDLKIREVTSSDNAFGPENLKFTFSIFSKNVTIPQSTGNSIILKKNTNPEFKIKKSGENNLTLERAWTAAEMAKKINLTCGGNSSPSNECKFGTTEIAINVLDGNDKLEGAKVQNGKITFEENQENYNQGFKYTVKDADISFVSGTTSDSISALEKDKSYEIIKKDGKWYFSKKN